jgi:hypothetical protein
LVASNDDWQEYYYASRVGFLITPGTTYYIAVTGYESSKLFTLNWQTNGVADAVVPASVTITSPAATPSITYLSGIVGAATDNANGSGIAKVDLYLRRKNTAGAFEFWGRRDGLWGWSTATAVIPTALSNGGGLKTSWYSSGVMPSGTQLPVGTYYPYAIAFDKSGNQLRSADATFTVGTTTSGRSTPVEKSAVVLSSASVSGTSVTLTFTGALNAGAATDVSRYAVTTAGGEALEIESIALKGGTSVVLGLPAGSLQSGEKLSINYNLLDSKNFSLSGDTTVTVK